tara:strand:+ start:417 stop:1058 length:642 start_codon:yes stop_codon:yes gene_type:complete
MHIAFIFISLTLFLGCESYQSRFSEKEYTEVEEHITHSDSHYYPIDGIQYKFKQLDYDRNNILRKETFFRDNKIHIVKLYNSNGYIEIEETYSKSIPQRIQKISYYPNGQQKERYTHIDYTKDGRYINYYKNGTLAGDLYFQNGIMVGACSWYFPSGNLKRIKEYTIDSDLSYQIDFYENGERKSEGLFSGDDFIGRWIFYDQAGTITSEIDY